MWGRRRGELQGWISLKTDWCSSYFVFIFASKAVSVNTVTGTLRSGLMGQLQETGTDLYFMQAICVRTPLNPSLMFRQKRGNGVNTAAEKVGLREGCSKLVNIFHTYWRFWRHDNVSDDSESSLLRKVVDPLSIYSLWGPEY